MSLPTASPAPLAHLRFSLAASRGRRFPEPPHPYRTDFQRDRDRIVHSRAFRRLENKTQVFAPHLSDHFRNRLTHTLEVAQIARTVAFALGLEEDLTETLALVHDIGHPPFGHSGEDELNRQMAAFGNRFDHNLHALRIVEHFESRYARFPGLNLTFEVREGIVKHSRDLRPGENPALDEYLPALRPPLEAQLIDLTDEIAYNTADLDDAYAAGLVDVPEICDTIPEFAAIWEMVETSYPAAEPRIQMLEAIRGLLNQLASGLIEGTRDAALAAKVQSVEDVRHLPLRLARFRSDAENTRAKLKHFLTQRVYQSDQLLEERRRSVNMIADLFAYYLGDVRRLPEPYDEHSRLRPAQEVVCEYIAGMTDSYCVRCWAEVFGPDQR